MKNSISAKYSKTLYSKKVLMKAAYDFIGSYYLHLDESADSYIVEFTPKKDIDQNVAQNFENELIAQSIRAQIFEDTKNIRELLIGRAMASSIVMEKDPVQLINSEENKDQELPASAILQDWFDQHETNH